MVATLRPPHRMLRRLNFYPTPKHERLAQLLRSERPPTIALVLSHLPPRRAGEVLACFPPAMGVEVVRRLADIENTDPETVRNVEQALESRWTRQAAVDAGPAVGGPEAVGKILAACDPQMRGRILANLADHDRPLAERFGHREMAFDDIAQCDDATLLAILRAAEPEVAQAALLGARRRSSSDSSARCPGKRRSGGALNSITRSRSD